MASSNNNVSYNPNSTPFIPASETETTYYTASASYAMPYPPSFAYQVEYPPAFVPFEPFYPVVPEQFFPPSFDYPVEYPASSVPATAFVPPIPSQSHTPSKPAASSSSALEIVPPSSSSVSEVKPDLNALMSNAIKDLKKGNDNTWVELFKTNIDQFDSNQLLSAILALSNGLKYRKGKSLFIFRHHILIESMKQLVSHKIASFSPNELVQMASCFANLGIYDEKIFSSISKSIQENIASLTPTEIEEVTSMFSTLGIRDQSLFSTISKHVVQNIKQFDTKSLSFISCAFATLNIRDKALFTTILKTHKNNIQKTPIITLANMARAFAMNYEPSYMMFLYLILQHAISQPGPFSINTTLLFHQVFLCLYFQDKIKWDYYMSSPLGRDMTKELEVRKATQPTSSHLHRNIHNTLEKMYGTKLQREHFISGYFFDTIINKEKKIALEVHGPTHYLSDGSPRGTDLFRTWILSKLGWTIIEIPYFEWDALKGAEEKKRYLSEKIPEEMVRAPKPAVKAQPQKTSQRGMPVPKKSNPPSQKSKQKKQMIWQKK